MCKLLQKDCGLAEKSCSKSSHKDIMGSSLNEGDGLGDELDSTSPGGQTKNLYKVVALELSLSNLVWES